MDKRGITKILLRFYKEITEGYLWTNDDKDDIDDKDVEVLISTSGKNLSSTVVGFKESKKLEKKEKSLDNKASDTTKTDNKEGIWHKVSRIFVPLIPGFVAGGFLIGISQIILTLSDNNIIPHNQPLLILATFLSILGSACFTLINVFVGINSARVFKCSTVLGGMVGGIVMLESVTDLAKMISEWLSNDFGITNIIYNAQMPADSLLYAGKGGIIAVIIGVWIFSKFEHWFRKRLPDSLDLIITPLFSYLFVGVLMIAIIMPLAGCASDLIASGLVYLGKSSIAVVKAIYGFILGALYLPLVLFGLHQSLMPLYYMEIQETGFSMMYCPQLMAGFAQIGAAICIYIKAKRIKHNTMCSTIIGALPSAFLGVGEPLIYGMSLPLMIVFVPIGIGAGIAGMFIALMNVQSFSFGPSALMAFAILPADNIWPFAIGALISIALTFILTWFFASTKLISKHKEIVSSITNKESDFKTLYHS